MDTGSLVVLTIQALHIMRILTMLPLLLVHGLEKLFILDVMLPRSKILHMVTVIGLLAVIMLNGKLRYSIVQAYLEHGQSFRIYGNQDHAQQKAVGLVALNSANNVFDAG